MKFKSFSTFVNFRNKGGFGPILILEQLLESLDKLKSGRELSIYFDFILAGAPIMCSFL